MSLQTTIEGLALAHFWPLQDEAGETAVDTGLETRAGTYEGGFTLGAEGPVAGSKAVKFDGATGAVKWKEGEGAGNGTLRRVTGSAGVFLYVEELKTCGIYLWSDTTGGNTGLGLGLGIGTQSGSALQLATQLGGGWDFLQHTPALVINTWYFIGASWTTNAIGAKWKLYVARVGASESWPATPDEHTTTITTGYAATDAFLAKQNGGGGLFKGRMAYVFEGGTVLTEAQLKSVWEAAGFITGGTAQLTFGSRAGVVEVPASAKGELRLGHHKPHIRVK